MTGLNGVSSNGNGGGPASGGLNGASAHASNGTTAATDKGCWTIGLINSKYKYLSAETFGFRTNANGKALKKKQVWILEPSGDGESVVLRSHLNKYVAVDQFGNVTCDQVIRIKFRQREKKVLPFVKLPSPNIRWFRQSNSA